MLIVLHLELDHLLHVCIKTVSGNRQKARRLGKNKTYADWKSRAEFADSEHDTGEEDVVLVEGPKPNSVAQSASK